MPYPLRWTILPCSERGTSLTGRFPFLSGLICRLHSSRVSQSQPSDLMNFRFSKLACPCVEQNELWCESALCSSVKHGSEMIIFCQTVSRFVDKFDNQQEDTVLRQSKAGWSNWCLTRPVYASSTNGASPAQFCGCKIYPMCCRRRSNSLLSNQHDRWLPTRVGPNLGKADAVDGWMSHATDRLFRPGENAPLPCSYRLSAFLSENLCNHTLLLLIYSCRNLTRLLATA